VPERMQARKGKTIIRVCFHDFRRDIYGNIYGRGILIDNNNSATQEPLSQPFFRPQHPLDLLLLAD
jgi:hypothetical protein